MLTPQFDGFEGSGFDKDATPRWQMVAYGNPFPTVKRVSLKNAAGMDVESVNTNIAIIDETTDTIFSDFRQFEITGKSPGPTFIEVWDPNSKTLFSRLLEIDVKNKLSYKIAYHFVEDNRFKQTKLDASILTRLHFNLNDIYENQTNITFDMTRAAPIQVNTSMDDIIREQEKNDPWWDGEQAWRGPYVEWNKLVKHGDPSALFNVFFVPRSKKEPFAGRPSLTQLDGDIVCEDVMTVEEVERALAHEICRNLGCPVTHDINRGNHLTFRWYPPTPDLRGGRFISKTCANIMNPTYRP